MACRPSASEISTSVESQAVPQKLVNEPQLECDCGHLSIAFMVPGKCSGGRQKSAFLKFPTCISSMLTPSRCLKQKFALCSRVSFLEPSSFSYPLLQLLARGLICCLMESRTSTSSRSFPTFQFFHDSLLSTGCGHSFPHKALCDLTQTSFITPTNDLFQFPDPALLSF